LKSETDLLEAAILKDFDMYCISSMENDIAEDEEEILQGIIVEDKDRKDTFTLYQSTRLQADEGIRYPGKAGLKKRFIPLSYRIAFTAAAAVVAFLIVLQVFRGGGPEDYQAARINQSAETSSDLPEISPPPDESGRSADENSPLTTQKRTIEIPAENDAGKQEKEIQLAHTSMADTEAEAGRENIELDRIAPKPVHRLAHSLDQSGEMPSSSLALRRTSRLPEHGKTAEIAADNPRLSLWILADAGVRGLNSVAEDEYHLDREKDKNGKTRRITFDTPVFGFSAPVRKPDKKQ
jgi:hypothetical protein